MRRSRPLLKLVLLAALVAGVAAQPVLTATNTVPSSRADELVQATSANVKKPAECSAVALTTVTGVTGAGTADLALGTTLVDTMNGAGGDDCVVGGAGNDLMAGGSGTDVCIGGPGVDVFNGNCETKIQ